MCTVVVVVVVVAVVPLADKKKSGSRKKATEFNDPNSRFVGATVVDGGDGSRALIFRLFKSDVSKINLTFDNVASSLSKLNNVAAKMSGQFVDK